MKALVWHGGHNLKVEEVARPVAGPGQVMVKVEAAAICTSDLHMDELGSSLPLILGHEVSGTIAGIGESVSGLAIGDAVALDPVQRCGSCWCCTHGIEHLCMNCRHLGWGTIQGGWAEYVAIDAANAHAMPEGVCFAAGCLAEPVAVCYESFQRAALKRGDQVLIIGDGPFGFLHAQMARALGAAKIIVAGHYDKRLARIAAQTQAVTCNTHHQELSDILNAEVGAPGVDIVVEATGAGASPHIGIKALRPRGTIVIFSYIWKPEVLDMGLIGARELNVLGSSRSLNAYGVCLDLMGRGKVDTEALVDMKAPLADFQRALDAVTQQKRDVFKAVFLPQM